MNPYEEKMKLYIENNKIKAEHMSFEESCHSVADAAKATNMTTDDIVKNICMIDEKERLIVAIVGGKYRASKGRIAKVLGVESVREATSCEIEEKTGYICGGVPSFGFLAIFLIDDKVLEREWVITGGGSQNSLLKIEVSELLKANSGQVVRIRS